jgi:hypothetical protein
MTSRRLMQSFRSFPLLAAALLGFLLPAAAFGQFTDTTGQTASGAYYKFRVPDGWNPSKGLVIWNHGYSFNPIGPVSELGPLVDLQISEGYAVAASSYRLSQWAVFGTVEDIEQMVEAFHDQVGVPAFVLVYGASLGGLVTVQTLEEAEIGNVVGAMPICGALAGSRAWDGAIDARLIYDVICGDVPGAAIAGGATGLSFPPDPNFNQISLGVAINACFGLPLPPEERTPEQQARLTRYLQVTGIPENFVTTVMTFSSFGLADLIYHPAKLNGAIHAVDNSNVDYGDAEINAEIQRVTGNPAHRALLNANYTPSGNIGDVRIVSLHTDQDGLVLLEHETDYKAKVPADRFTVGIVTEAIPTHCGFTAAELVAGWESLRGWVGGGPQPSPASLQFLCQNVEQAGAAAGPCRINPLATLPPVEARIRPREVCVADSDTLCLNGGRFKVEIDWTTPGGETGFGRPVTQTDDTGAFYYFSPNNLEMMVKVLDGRQINGHFWVFYGSLSNVQFTMTVTDTVTGLVKSYENGQGMFASNGDTSAF